MWNSAQTKEEEVEAIQERIKTWSESSSPRAAKILRLRLVKSFDELDSILTELGFTKQIGVGAKNIN